MASVLSQAPVSPSKTGRGPFSLSHNTFGAPLEESSGVRRLFVWPMCGSRYYYLFIYLVTRSFDYKVDVAVDVETTTFHVAFIRDPTNQIFSVDVAQCE